MTANLLMIEDDPHNIRGTKMLIEQAGVTVEVADCVAAAEALLRTKVFQLLLVDWTLPRTANGPSDRDAGGYLIQRLTSGELGDLNRTTRYFIITKQTDQFDAETTAQRLGVLSKLDALGIVRCVTDVLAGPA